VDFLGSIKRTGQGCFFDWGYVILLSNPLSFSLGRKRAIRIRTVCFLPKSSQAEKAQFEFEQHAFCLSPLRQKKRCLNSNSVLSA
jgi:hypothetical protein